MSDNLYFDVDWAVATKNKKVVTREIWKHFLGFRYRGTHTKTFPTRTYDTRNGDVIPEKGLSSLERQMSLTTNVRQLYLYPGEEPEHPTFEHCIGRAQLHDRQTLMASIELDTGHFFEIAADKMQLKIDESVSMPAATITVFQKLGFMEYPGHQPVRAVLTFQSHEQKEAMTKELFSRELIEEAAA